MSISEFLASNTSGLRDEDGDYSDWIEIFNGGTNPVNLNGWFLTDSPGNLTRWRFPATNLPPNGFLVVFASSKNRAVAGAPLHANFGLSAGGEYLALVLPDGITIANEFAPVEQFANVSYGIGQNLQVTSLVSNDSPAVVYVPTNSTLGTSWTGTAFDDSTWRRGTNGVGYESYVSGFAVKNIRANGGVCDMSTAESVLANPSQQAGVFTENRSVINYANVSGSANYASDFTFPGFTIGVDENNFVTEATGIITIPTSGFWTFGVNSDDGFQCTIGANTFSFPAPRGPGDTFATFNLAAGEYPVRLIFYECQGGAELEFFAASGTYTGFNSTAFRLVGSPTSGALAVKSLPVSSGSSGGIRPLITTDVQNEMRNRNGSAYVRFPFTLADPAAFSSLTLRMKYDDGFVAYLNGTEVARRNAPATPQWNSTATTSRPNTAVVIAEDIDLTSRLNLLQAGGNVLAIQGLNFTASDSDFLVRAELMENKVLGLTNHYFSTATPGGFNSAGFFAFVDNLKFDPGRGWFDNTNISITITSATPGITIRYTTNGSVPSLSSGITYTGAIPVNRTTLLRAIGYRDGFEPTELETHSYIFLNQVQNQSTNANWAGGSSGNYTLNTAITQDPLYRDAFKSDLLSVPTLSIVASWDDMFGPNGVYSNPQGYGVAWERPCSLEYMRPDGEDGFHINCGLRIQGGVSRSAIEKHGLRALFKSVYGAGKLKYDLYPGSPVSEFDTLTLHGGFNDHWLWVGGAATLQRDQWCRDAQNAMGGYGPHGTYVHLYLNGIYWGLYNIGEKGDGAFAAGYLGGEKEEYDAFNSDELIDGTPDAWNTMFSIASAGVTNDVAYTNLSQYLNIPNFVDYMLMNFYAANTDWPGHNWNAARRRAPGAGFHFFSWDAEWTFGVGSGITTDRTGIGAGDGSPGRLYAALRAHPEFRREFGDHAQKYLFNGGALTPGPAQERWTQRTDEIERAIIGETARWGNGNTPQTWRSAENAVLSWFPQRTSILINQLRAAGLYPALDAPAFTPLGGLVPPGYSLVLTNPNAAGTIYFTLDGKDPRVWGGAISPSAQAYSSPLVLNNATFIRARVFSGGNWSALIEAVFYVVQDFGALQVTEIMYNPPPLGNYPADDFEFLELKNTGTSTLDLSGLQFSSGITFAFTNGTRLLPGGFFVLVRSAEAFALKYPGTAINGVFTGRLDNGGEKLTLEHVLGTNIFSFSYNDALPWPITPDGYGFSLVRANSNGDPDASFNWRPSANSGGSPGMDDPPSSIPEVLINEILTHTDPPQVDTIELYNPTPTTVDLGGWFLSDDPDQPTKFRISNGTTIAPRDFVVFTEAQFNPQPGVPPSFALNSHGESLYLFSGNPAATNLTGYSHSFEYGAAANGVSFGRYVISTGDEEWPAMEQRTFGASNSAPRVGPIVINEIMYHPAPGYDEFIELYNTTGSSVPLYDSTNAWKLNGLGYTFSNNVSIPGAGYLLIVPIDPGEFRTKYGVPSAIQIVGPHSGALENSGERLRLERPDAPEINTNGTVFVPYVVVDEVRYNDRLPWGLGADGDGPSLQRRTPTAYGNEPTNWFASGITPGRQNVFNQAPLCTLTSPTNGAEFTVPATITFTASASDPDGSIARVEFYDGDILLGMDGAAPFAFVWSNASAGPHTVLAKARDDGLAVTISAGVSIVIRPPPVGSGIGLRADYYDNIDFTGVRVRRIDPTISFDWGTGQPDAAIGSDQFSVRWVGQVQPRFSETYNFYTFSDDGVRLWVNNQLLIDNWTDHGPTENVGFIALQAGYLYDIKMEMYENSGGATAQLSWSAPSVTREFVPSTQLYPPTGSNLPPVVTLTSPSTGAVFVATSAVNLTADANDPDGVITKVEFYSGASKLGEDTASPFAFSWPSVPAGQHILRAIASDDSGLSRTSAPVNITALAGFTSNVTFVATGAVWRYRDTGENLGNAWNAIAFNDTTWSNGPAQLGYGDGDERTIVSYGPNASAKYTTTYFRNSFDVGDPTAFNSLNLRVMRDDGVVIYLNGSEVFRDNMPAGAINYLTAAVNSIGGTDESTFYSAGLNPGYLVFGKNTLAAEIHQQNGTSTDISFDFELVGGQTFVAPYFTQQPESQTAAEGSAVSLTPLVTGTAPLRFQWRFNGTNLPNATNATLSFPGVQLANAGNYFVVVTNLAGSATSTVATLTISTSDTDHDGMPDFWEQAHGLDPGVNDAGIDSDGDGMTNFDEFIAGTHPRRADSYLKVDRITSSLGAPTIEFLAVSNRTYTVLRRAFANVGSWKRLSDVPSHSTNRVAILMDTNAAPSQFYRLVTPSLP